MEDRSRNHSVLEWIRYYSLAAGLASVGMLLRTTYAVMWALSSIRIVVTFGFVGYSLAITLMQAFSALGWAVNAFLMYRMFKAWKRKDADRYLSVMTGAGMIVVVTNVLQGVFSTYWWALLGGWSGMIIAAAFGCVAGYYLLCRKEEIEVKVVLSPGKMWEDFCAVFRRQKG